MVLFGFLKILAVLLCSANYVLCGCPFFMENFQEAKEMHEPKHSIKRQFLKDSLKIVWGEPGAGFWVPNTGITQRQNEILKNASIAKLATEMYLSTTIITTNGSHHTMDENMAKLKSCSSSLPEEYRCRKLGFQCDFNAPFRMLDGSCNNVQKPFLGATYSQYNRIIAPVYSDGIHDIRRSTLSNMYLKSPREIGNHVFRPSNIKEPNTIANVLSLFFGQYIGHDVGLRLNGQTQHDTSELMRCCSADYKQHLPPSLLSHECAPIAIPSGDPFYSKYNMTCMQFVRSMVTLPNDCQLGPSTQANTVTSFIDKSVLYGNSKEQTDQIRSFVNGRLATNKYGNLPVMPDCNPGDFRCWLAGDSRTTQTTMLTTMVLLNLHLHNYFADGLAIVNPHWNDERLFQEARRIAIAVYQRITYHEWIPLFLGSEYTQKFKIICKTNCSDYDANIDPSAITDFSQGAMRTFHRLVPGFINLYKNDKDIVKTRQLSDVVLTPYMLNTEYGDTVRGMLFQQVNATNTYSFQMRNKLYKNGNEYGVGFDLSSVDIQRARDHGLAPYYQYLELCSSIKINQWSDLLWVILPEDIERLQDVYETVFDIDFIVGISLEYTKDYLGPTSKCTIGTFFYKSRRGDRYFYTNEKSPNPFTKNQMAVIENFTIAKLVCLGSKVENVPRYAFVTPSKTNPILDCKNLRYFNLELWKD